MPWKEKPSKSNRKNVILVVRAPFCMKAEAMGRTYKQLAKQMETGLVLLPAGYSVAFCSPDVEVKLMDSNNDIFKEEKDD